MQIEKRDEEVVVTRPTERGEDRALPDPDAHREHGRGSHQGLREAPGDPGRRVPRPAQGHRPRARRRFLASGHDQAARGISFDVPAPTQIIVKGIDKQAVGQTAAEIRKVRRPSRTRARASATATTSRRSAGAGRSGSARERDDERQARMRRHRRVRSKIAGTAERPRLAVFRSNRGIFAQLVDDSSGRTLAAAGWNSFSSSGSRPSRRAPSARPSARRRRRPVSSAACSIAAATCTTDASRRSQRARARKD